VLRHKFGAGVEEGGAWAGRAQEIGVDGFTLADGEGCAVLIQDNRQGPIIGAAPCPTETS